MNETWKNCSEVNLIKGRRNILMDTIFFYIPVALKLQITSKNICIYDLPRQYTVESMRKKEIMYIWISCIRELKNF